MKVKILGYRYAQGTSKKNNRPYNGFFTCLGYEDRAYTGIKCEERFISAEVLQGVVPTVGEEYEIGVDFGGYITSVKPVFKPNLQYSQPMQNPAPMNQNAAPVSAPTEQPAQNQQNQKK